MSDGQRDAAARAALERLGLRAGDALAGWTVAGVEAARDSLVVRLARGRFAVDAHLRAATGAPCFARVGDVELFHRRVDGGDAAMARAVLHAMQAVQAHLARRPSPVRLDGIAPPRPHAAAYDAGDAPPLDPSLEAGPDDPVLGIHTIDVADLARFPDAVRRMYDGTLGGLVVRGVYSSDAMAGVVRRLETRDPHYPRTSFPARFKAHFYGRCLDGADPALDEYLADAARFRAATDEAFAGLPPFEARMEAIFRALAGGREVALPHFVDGRPYTPATIRILLEGGQIGVHCGNEAATRPAYSHLNTIIDPVDQISYFLTLQEPLAGGELIVYALRWSDIDASRLVGGRTQVDDLLATSRWMRVAPGAGDLLLFDGGRYFHRVDVVRGARLRWTIGGFLMFDRGGRTLHYWS